jgi:nucleoside-diphosphate-sugar epimerase
MTESLTGSTVLITGANGFLGRHLIGRLRGKCRLHAVSRSEPREKHGVRWWRVDLRDRELLAEVAGTVRPDVVFHLASASQGGQGMEFVLPTFENDLQSTVNLLLVATATGCKRILLSASLEEPEHNGKGMKVTSPYAAAKAASTTYGLMFHQLYKAPVTILRPFMTYGPGQKSYKIVPYTISSLLQGEAPKLSSGTRPVDWIYVDDVITAFLEAAVRPEAVGEVIDLGSGALVPIRDVVEEIHSLIPGAPVPLFGALPERAMENVRCAETSTAQRILGWQARTTLRQGLTVTVESLRRQLELEGALPALPRV